jgi:serine/threonine protein kinase
MTLLNARELTLRLAPLLLGAGLHFKYVRDVVTLQKLNSGAYGYSQIGKCLVVYLPHPGASILRTLKDALGPYRDQCPAVPCARPFGGRLPLYYRFGSYVGSTLVLDHHEVEDNRSSLAHAVPEGMADALAAFTDPEPDDTEVRRFLRRYPIFRALAQQGKCGVFHAMDATSETLREVVLKAGYHRGQLQADGTDGCDLLRRELACYRILAERGLDKLAPALLDVLDVPRKVVLVLEYIDGASLLHHKVTGRLRVRHLERAWALLKRFHAADVYLGDAKLANFLVTPDDDVRAVDFEAAGVIGDHAAPIRTFFVTPELGDPRRSDLAHFLVSVLYDYERGRNSWAERHIDLRTLKQDPSDEADAWALERLCALLDAAPHSL